MSKHFLTHLADEIHTQNVRVGWWNDSVRYGGPIPDTYFIPAKIALMHSELSEGLEGQRKSLMDDHLPEYDMEAVEYADTIIRILDVCGAKGYDIGVIIDAKRAYNETRLDHQLEVRNAPGGKAI